MTGTFDNWSKSEKLIKTGDVFEKNVTLSSATEKIYYKVRGGNKQFARLVKMSRAWRFNSMNHELRDLILAAKW